ncbi:tetratricopeptide repeat protein [Maricaulis maris]|jgi:uncharacterized protein|uniref:tetratricopeptide repeat protein n=1 Tax=Maricaulis maris TaxID=74318 RepID=UPI00291F4B4C|nr:hypothetical protein MACH15_01450 [Maricaulis maris]
MFRLFLCAVSLVIAGLGPSGGALAATPPPDAVDATDTDTAFEVALDRYIALIEAEPIDPVEAARLREEVAYLADGGHGPALNLLAIITEQGVDRPANPQAAYALYRLAAQAGSPDAAINLAVRDIGSDDAAAQAAGIASLDALLIREDVSDTQRALVNGYRGWALARTQQADPADTATAISLLEGGLLADPGNAAFNRALAELLEPLAATAAERVVVLDHYQRAGEAGDGRAAWKAGMMHLDGSLGEPDPVEALRWVNVAAIAGLDDGLISLAVMHAIGQGTPVDGPRARALYADVAMRGNAHALRALGAMLIFGEGGPAEPARGVALLELAADAGDQLARRILDDIAPQLPDTTAWTGAVLDARSSFLRDANLAPSDLYGAQTSASAAPAVMTRPE